MKTSQRGIELIKHFEGLYLKAYYCPAGIPTIGYGSTEGVKMGMVITEAQAEQMLKAEVSKFEAIVNKLVKVPLSQYEFDALVSFAYNLGGGALGQSTLLRKLNSGDKQGAAEEFLRWNKAIDPKTGIKKTLEGLTKRRAAERELFLMKMNPSGNQVPIGSRIITISATPGTFIKKYCLQSSELGEGDKKWLPQGSQIEIDNYRGVSKHYQVYAKDDWWDTWWVYSSHCEIQPLNTMGTPIISEVTITNEQPPVEVGGLDLCSRLVRFMQSQGYRLFTEPGQLNIIALEGIDPDGTLNDDRPNYFNDLLVVLNHKLELLDSFVCTTEPGRYYTNKPLNKNGAAKIKFGQYSAWQVGLHNGKYQALVQTGGPVTVIRDKNRNFIRDSGDVEDTGYFGINIHHGGDSPLSDIGRYSAGCTVIASTKQFQEFLSLVKTNVGYRQSKDFVFTVAYLPGDKVMAC